MKVTVFLRNDHEELNRLFNQFKKPGPRTSSGKSELFNGIRREILIHSEMESEIFYPALAATASSRATELLSVAEMEHQEIEGLIGELNSMGVSDNTFDSKMAALMEKVTRHIEIEEEEIFDEARKNLPEFRLEELGLEMEDRKRILGTLAA